MKAWFDIQDVDHHDKSGKVVKKVPTLFFHLVKPSTACSNAQPFEFHGPATEAHRTGYGRELAAFEALHGGIAEAPAKKEKGKKSKAKKAK